MRSIFLYVRWIILTGSFFRATILLSQQGGNIFYNLTTANGLSSNRTTSVIQDKHGYYWIGTLDGLNRFDGTSCRVFQNVQNDSTSLSHNNCIGLLEDDAGNIWVATLMGVNRYKNNGKFERFFFHNPRENFERANWIGGMIKDSSGNIWITSCGLWQYNIHTREWRQWLHGPKDANSIPAGSISSPFYDQKRNCIWMSGSNGLIMFDISAGKFYHKKNNPQHSWLLDKTAYNSPIILDNNHIWTQPGPRITSRLSSMLNPA
jgi:ligand-binding sensor domain-containing protein